MASPAMPPRSELINKHGETFFYRLKTSILFLLQKLHKAIISLNNARDFSTLRPAENIFSGFPVSSFPFHFGIL